MGSRTVIQKFVPNKWPSDQAIRIFLFDKDRVRTKPEPFLWVVTCGVEIDLDAQMVDISDPSFWKITGLVSKFPARPQHVGIPFALSIPKAFWNRNANATFEVEVALLPNKECECCPDGTVYEFNDDGYICPACRHGRPPIRLWEKPKPHGVYPPKCMSCGSSMVKVGSRYVCYHCHISESAH